MEISSLNAPSDVAAYVREKALAWRIPEEAAVERMVWAYRANIESSPEFEHTARAMRTKNKGIHL